MKNNRKAGIIILLLCSYSFGVDNDALSKYDYETYNRSIGVGAGYITGLGFSVKKWFNNTWALQMNLLPYYYPQTFKPGNNADNDSGYSDIGYLSFGITYMRLLSRQRDFRLVTYIGTNINTSYDNEDYYYTRNMWDYYRSTYVDSLFHEKHYRNESKIALGGGIGGECFFWKRFSLNLLVGIRGWYNTAQQTLSVSPSADGGIYFVF